MVRTALLGALLLVAPIFGQDISKDQSVKYTINTDAVPGLKSWADKELMALLETWHPKLIALLPDPEQRGYKEVSLIFRDGMKVPAYASGNVISLNAAWFPANLNAEAKGCVVHELVHVVQNYQTEPRPPLWISEGIADYVRWFLYEPEKRGAEIRDPALAKHDASYRISANFIDWVVRNKDRDLLRKLNTACRDGKYSDDLWKTWTGSTLAELSAAWKAAIVVR